MEKYDKGKVCACLPCRCTKFVPTTIPRYNKAGVEKHVWMSDLREYNEHRKRCFYAKPIVDARPPYLDLSVKFKPLICYKDAHQAMMIDKQNKHFMMRLIEMDRLGGFTDTVNSAANFHMSNWQGQKGNMLKIVKQNKEFHKRIIAVKSYYAYKPKEWRHFLDSLRKAAHYPLTVLKKRDLDEEVKAQPSISIGFPKISNHIECFMDFTMQNGEYLGRITIELYHEIAPLHVHNFVDFCEKYSQQTKKNIIVQRIVKDRYFESNFITNNKTENKGKRNTKPVRKIFKMKHSRAGTISMIRDETHSNNLKLCLTLCPMPELDRKNEVFGKVTKGIDVLVKINGYGRKIGKPLDVIIISDCGEMPPCICHKKTIRCKPF
ncbi:peptidyl-prolyl cis-trans isomerase E-like [Harmonia axyridis]|uniref:peptidyl-prolyl cis-trans isomerase E-like n=1 Tax=Harmonia axyridis TaxID=115357 RepID=UPI001E277A4B|nr:peptidyl-prolyl cis-trans isomerase E-like [Harmonia axyridis]